MQERYLQYSLPLDLPPEDNVPAEQSKIISSSTNSIGSEDRAFHDWYRFVLSYPPHLVRDYISDFELDEQSVILDPFCGTGTTLVEAKLKRIKAIGLEANPFPHFASTVKTDWNITPDELQVFADQVSESTYAELTNQGISDRSLTCEPAIKVRTLNKQALRALIKDSISPLGKTTPWLVFFGEPHQNIRQQAKDLGVLLTGIQEWEELKRLVCETCLDKSDE
jgi:hypothetical protein